MTRPEAPARTDSFRPVLGAAVVLFLALLAVAALKSYRDLASARAREHLLAAQIEETKARSERLRARIDRLHHDPGMLERLAREDLGMVHPGDVIIELPAGAVAPRSPRAPAPSPVTATLPGLAVTPGPELMGPPAPPVSTVPASLPSGHPGQG
ncbi:MAG TPA: septum formation initiator family protein [Thermoanaerobaculia bacterium]|nr:septum formation initiator family protein [Thermoanaerobaculia bacterium]